MRSPPFPLFQREEGNRQAFREYVMAAQKRARNAIGWNRCFAAARRGQYVRLAFYSEAQTISKRQFPIMNEDFDGPIATFKIRC